MIELLIAQATCPYQTYPILVCDKWINRKYDGSRLYRIKVSTGHKLYVNRCTYLANQVGQPYKFEVDKKWCDKEKVFKSVWAY